MSMELLSSEPVCYVHCNFCNTILAVNVPFGNMLMSSCTIVTVRCGHCSNLLSVNMPAFLLQQKQHSSSAPTVAVNRDNSDGSSAFPAQQTNTTTSPIPPPEKRQRVPSAYNRFIREEIQRIKASNPEISHREAFSTAAKNWAHFPHIHFGLKLGANKQPN